MHKLGEQWVGMGIDREMHMYKACEKSDAPCIGCCNQGKEEECYNSQKDCGKGAVIIKDLGPVNEVGLLACPFCREFPKGVSKGTEYKNDCEISIFYIEHSCTVIQTTEFTYSEQQSIDAWNRRV